MFPVLVVMYIRLAISEERDAERAFGQAWRDYASETPRFVPYLSRGDRARPVRSQ
jgi:protein-S-isoprenylcysteine O-methyltransferase Ste14